MPLHTQSAAARGLLTPDAPPAAFAPTLAACASVRHGFFGREGGVSAGIYASLNAGPGSKDAPEAVAENRRRIAASFGLAPQRLVGVHQVHSPTVHFAEAQWPGARPEGDALVTATPGLALSVLTADCAPVLFADSEARVIGAAHAGWRGALTSVLEATVARMVELGAQRERIVAAIGPCIEQASYEVGPEFEAHFLVASAGHARFFIPGAGDRRHFDLPAFCAARLEAAGVCVDVLATDTFTDANGSFSHRRSLREGASDYGRNCAAIALV